MSSTPHKPSSWQTLVRGLVDSRSGTDALASVARKWKLTYLIEETHDRVVLRILRVRLRKDGTDGEITEIKNLDTLDTSGLDNRDRLILFRLSTVPEFGVWKNGHSQGENGSRWNPSGAAFSDVLHLLEGKDVELKAFSSQAKRRIDVVAGRSDLVFDYQEADDQATLTTSISSGGVRHDLPADAFMLLQNPGWLVAGPSLFYLPTYDMKSLDALRQSGWKVVIPRSGREKFRHELLPKLLESYSVTGPSIDIRDILLPLARRIQLEEYRGKLIARLIFRYGDHPAPYQGHLPFLIVPAGDSGSYNRINRDLSAEHQAVQALKSASLSEGARGVFVPTIDPFRWIVDMLPVLAADGFEIFGEDRLRHHRIHRQPSLQAGVSSGTDWFDVDFSIAYDGGQISYTDFRHAVSRGERFVRLADGSMGMLPPEWIERFRRVFSVGTGGESTHRFSLYHASLIHDVLGTAELRHSDERFSAIREKIASFETITHKTLPATLHADLRQYQHAGYDWLLFLKDFGFSGCLADDMGLGKTVQTLALLLHEYGNGATLPTLIVVPTSLIFNWINEARKFAPSLRFMSYTGTQRRQSKQHLDNIDIVLTTYGTLRRDIEIFANMEFHYVILDESQNIKNARSQTARCVRRLKGNARLALTGTPVENNLMELWSQFAFLQPGFLGSESEFREQFAMPIEKEQNAEAARVLKAMTYPFMLRRTKELVAGELPPKIESVTYCEMDRAQQNLYEDVRDGYRNSIMETIEKEGLNKSRMKVLEGLMKLREICCHPVLIEEQYAGSSGKFDVWKGMLEEILAEGHKVLVFSQFVKMLRVLSSHCDAIGIDYEYLDGQTRDREERVRRFQEDGSVKLFLISLKAGGTGLNLTSADYVIHYDPWWNPAVEAQATDRTHRIGQTKNVFSYKLITRDSVEEKILQLQEKKRALVESVISSEAGFLKSLSRKDIENLFS